MVLGAIVERLTGTNYFDYVRERIFVPSTCETPTPGPSTMWCRTSRWATPGSRTIRSGSGPGGRIGFFSSGKGVRPAGDTRPQAISSSSCGASARGGWSGAVSWIRSWRRTRRGIGTAMGLWWRTFPASRLWTRGRWSWLRDQLRAGLVHRWELHRHRPRQLRLARRLGDLSQTDGISRGPVDLPRYSNCRRRRSLPRRFRRTAQNRCHPERSEGGHIEAWPPSLRSG